MDTRTTLPRREFLATSAAVAAAGYAGSALAQEAVGGDKLAVEGGPKAVTLENQQGPRFGEPERKQLEAMLQQDTLFYWKGPQTETFVERFQEVCPSKHVMTCSSGTAALHIAVAAAGIGPGDEVITAPVTDIGTVIGVIYQQAVPVFADLGASTYNVNVETVEARITPKTKAIIAVHLAGNPCDLEPLKALADKHGLVLIEDCAQAWGAKYRGKPVGTIGHIACWSLQNSKHITTGDGGVVASRDERFGPLLQPFGDKGFKRLEPGQFELFSTNYRMSETQAAVGAGQLTRLEDIVAARAALGNLLTERIAGVPGITGHEVHPEDRCAYWFYMLRMDPKAFTCDRAAFVKALAAEGVSASAGYIPVPLQRNPVFLNHGFFNGRWPIKEMGLTDMDYTKHETPEAEAILKTGIRIVVHESMTKEYMAQVGEAVRKVARHYAV